MIIPMLILFVLKRRVLLLLALLALIAPASSVALIRSPHTPTSSSEAKYIKWVDFNIPHKTLELALKLDVDSRGKYNWIDMLSLLASKYGGEFSRYKESDLRALINRIDAGEEIGQLASGLKNFEYFKEAYSSVLGEFVGKFYVVQEDGSQRESYGLKAFSPIAKGYPYRDFDDFGNGRSYGYKRKHLGHDYMAQTGTPVIAVESGTVEELGWNQYGGWRIGIRSFDKKRYFYYAHLRQNRPYAKALTKGASVRAGDVIGYVGRTGYSTSENTNNIRQSHLHFGLQLIFDESQKEGTNQIWIDFYQLSKLLERNRSAVRRTEEDPKEYVRAVEISQDV